MYLPFFVALTVIVRIFYSVDRRNCGRISLRELRRSDLVEAFNLVDEEEDINKVGNIEIMSCFLLVLTIE